LGVAVLSNERVTFRPVDCKRTRLIVHRKASEGSWASGIKNGSGVCDNILHTHPFFDLSLNLRLDFVALLSMISGYGVILSEDPNIKILHAIC
jgi:hypothetical protein